MKDDPFQRNLIYVDCLQSQCPVEVVKLRVAGSSNGTGPSLSWIRFVTISFKPGSRKSLTASGV